MLKRMFVLMVFFGLMAAMLPTRLAVANEGCEIPESGPWPPCATGGEPAQSPASDGECVIPESGPWPPCATGGDATAPPPSNDSACVVPESGPWPPCATGGGSAAPASTPTPTSDEAETEIEQGFRITNVEILNKAPYQVDIQLDYSGNTAEFTPLIVVFDPDNCFDPCNQRENLRNYHVNGNVTITSEETAGTVDVAIDIDQLICPYNPVTERMIVAVIDRDEMIGSIQVGEPAYFDLIYQFPLAHQWCQ